jgi:hypothetical protein
VRLARYPVKSFQGEVLDTAEIGTSGAEGDRRWAVFDPAANKAVSAKREPRLLEASARTNPDGTITVTLPDGTTAPAGDPDLDQAVATWLDRDVHLKEADPVVASRYEMNLDNTDPESQLVDIPCPPGTFLDFGAVHLLTTASIRTAQAVYPDGDWSVERFRPTILVECDEDGYPEDDWIGKSVTIGDVVLQVFMPTIRCRMTTMAQPAQGLGRDLDIVKTINKEHGANFGVYAVVANPGRLSGNEPVNVG